MSHNPFEDGKDRNPDKKKPLKEWTPEWRDWFMRQQRRRRERRND